MVLRVGNSVNHFGDLNIDGGHENPNRTSQMGGGNLMSEIKELIETLDFLVEQCQESGEHETCLDCCIDNSKNCEYSENVDLIKLRLQPFLNDDIDKNHCEKCHYLVELLKRTPQTNKDYWLMTELFVMLHGSDVCREKEDEDLAGKILSAIISRFTGKDDISKYRDNKEYKEWKEEIRKLLKETP